MARFNTQSTTTSVAAAGTIASAQAFTEFTGTAPYTVALPSPVLCPGSSQTFYNATAGTVTLSTPSGIFGGLGASGAGTQAIPTNTVVSITSDGVNYIVLSEDGSALVATTGSFTGNVTANGASATVSLTPQTVTIAPTGTSTIDNVNIGANTRGSGAFTTLTANSAVTFTANTTSSSTGTGTLVVTGGVGVSGAVYAAGLYGPLTGTLQTAAQTNITSLGTITSLSAGSVSASLTVNAVGGILANGENFEKYLGLKSFADGVANRAINVQFGNFALGGRFEITITGTYSNQNAGGGITKVFSVLTNPSNNIYTNESRVTTVVGPIVSNFAIGEFQWDSGSSQYIIPISHIVSTGNPVYVHIKVYGIGNTANVYNNVTLSDPYTLTALNRNYEYFNGNVGIGTTSPGSILEVKTTTPIITLSPSNYTNQYQTTLGTRSGAEAFLIFGNNGLNEIRAGRSNTGGYLDFYTNNTAAQTSVSDGNFVMRMAANGNVGVGTTGPATQLHVVGTDSSANRTNVYNVMKLTAESGQAPYNGFGPGLVFAARAYTSGIVDSARISGYVGNDSVQSTGGSLGFDVSATVGSSLYRAVTVGYNGSVGIGGSGQTQRLYLTGSVQGWNGTTAKYGDYHHDFYQNGYNSGVGNSNYTLLYYAYDQANWNYQWIKVIVKRGYYVASGEAAYMINCQNGAAYELYNQQANTSTASFSFSNNTINANRRVTTVTFVSPNTYMTWGFKIETFGIGHEPTATSTPANGNISFS